MSGEKVVVYGKDQVSGGIDWAGEFGDAYHERVSGTHNPLAMFVDILGSVDNVTSVIEFGAGSGRNLSAIGRLVDAELTGVEVNPGAVEQMCQLPDVDTICGSVLGYSSVVEYDLVLTSALLIHVDPSDLEQAYDALYRASRRYICLVEYYNPTPVEVPYRGSVLWKRDFAGEMLDEYDLKLADYGFVYHRDTFPQDDVTWFLLQKEKK